jgi:hypothetical protein
MKRITTILAVTIVLVVSTHGQGFLNLDFESAYNLPGDPGYGVSVSATNALPDWSAYNDYTALANINYSSNTFFGTTASVGLVGGSLALSGNFSAELYLNGSISQTGLVPDNVESLQFEGYGVVDSGGFSVSLGGQTLSYSTISEDPDYDVYGANIPAGMDGQTEVLAFLCQGVGSGGVVLDNIEFSTMSVPAPPECGLIGLGAILVGLNSRWKQGVSKEFTQT